MSVRADWRAPDYLSRARLRLLQLDVKEENEGAVGPWLCSVERPEKEKGQLARMQLPVGAVEMGARLLDAATKLSLTAPDS